MKKHITRRTERLSLALSLAMLLWPSSKAHSQMPEGGQDTVRTDINAPLDSLRALKGRAGGAFDVMMPEVLYKTPEAAAFQKYGEFTVSEFTGTPDIRIPLYTLKYKDVEIPIELTYDAEGITVEQEASWVGLGWNLMVGGCVNLVQSGSTDPRILFSGESERTDFMSQGTGDFLYAEGSDLSCGDLLIADLRNGFGERDYFRATLPKGGCLSFSIDPATGRYEVLGEDADQYKIEDLSGGTDITEAEWAITDGDGWVYYFEPGERVTEQNLSFRHTSTWNLVRILTSEGSVVDFEHTRPPALIHSRPSLTERYDHVGQESFPSYPSPGYTGQLTAARYDVSPTYLTSVSTYDQTVTFTTGTREDFPGARKLESITVLSALTGDTIRQTILNYGYFRAPQSGGDYLTSSAYTGGQDDLELRLKLLSVCETGGGDTLTTSFTYNESASLPIKTSYACDFWGYYNGRDNSCTGIGGASYTMLPTPLPILLAGNDSISGDFLRMKAADRYCDPTLMQAGMLTAITYPLKGSTVFEYEPHRFTTGGAANSQKYPTVQGYAAHVVSGTAADWNHPGDITHRDFTVDSRAAGTLTVSFQGRLADLKAGGAYVTVIPHAPSSLPAQTFNLNSLPDVDLGSTYGHSATVGLRLPANGYTLLAFCPDGLGPGYGVSASLSLHNRFTSASVPESVGGGLRVRKITNLDEDGSVCDSTVFDYRGEDGKTSGLLLRPLTSFDSKTVWVITSLGELPGEVAGTQYHLSRLRHPSCDMPSPFISMSGGTVGYSTVVKRMYGPDGALRGTVTSCYTDSVPKSFMGKLWYFNCHGNGRLISRTVSDASGRPLSRTERTYGHTVSRRRTSVTMDDTYINLSGEAGSFTSTPPRYRFWFYPFVTDWDRLLTETETLYGEGGETVSSTAYTYSERNHRVRTVTEDSSVPGTTLRTRYRYTFDFTQGAEAAMADSANFMVNTVVEESLSTVAGGGESLLKSRRNVYGLLSGCSRDLQRSVYLPVSTRFSLSGGTAEQRLSYTYTPQCDLRSVEKDTAEKAVYLWGYGHMYPVAEIKGATYAQVSQWATASLIRQIGQASSGMPQLLAVLRSRLSGKGVLVTTFTYTPLRGTASATSPNGTVRQYTYDGLGRLTSVSDGQGSVIQTHRYHIKP